MSLALHWQILIAMCGGAALGIGLSVSTGRHVTEMEHAAFTVQLTGTHQPVTVPAGKLWVLDSQERTLIQVEPADPDRNLRRIIVGDESLVEKLRIERPEPWPKGDDRLTVRRQVSSFDELKSVDPIAYVLFQRYGRSWAHTVGDWSQAAGDLFLRMLKMVSIPLVIASLLSGVTGLGQAERVGTMFGRTLLYYLTTSMLAIATGLAMVNLIQPGIAGNPAVAQQAAEGQQAGKSLGTVLFEQLENLIPTNPFAAAAEGNFLSVIAFTLAVGISTLLVGGTAAERIRQLVDAVFEVMMRLTMLIIMLAPLGVFFLMLSATASQGVSVFRTLGWYMVTVALALACHATIVLPAILQFVAKRKPAEFASAMSPALLTAFSSASSNGTLPLTLTCVEKRGNISNRVGSFVLPLGATINMDGTALYEVVAVLFIAQLSGLDLTLAQQLVVALTALLASIGAAGIPHAGLVMMVIILQAVGLPTESQGLIIAVDRVLDMGRTAVNVWSDSCGCAVVEALGSKA